MVEETKRLVDRNGIELRSRAKSRKADTREPALAELRRRVGNLRGAVVPEWEKAARGRKLDEWELV